MYQRNDTRVRAKLFSYATDNRRQEMTDQRFDSVRRATNHQGFCLTEPTDKITS